MKGRKLSVWADLPGYEGLYQVSDMGGVRSLPRVTSRVDRWGNKGQVKFKGRELRPQPTNNVGHLKVSLSKDGVVTQHLVHALVWEAHRGTRDVINHLNGKAWDNRLSNLCDGTQAENLLHAREFGKWDQRGEKATGAKLTESKVREIRKLRREGFLLREIAPRFGVDLATISYVCSNQTWRHVK